MKRKYTEYHLDCDFNLTGDCVSTLYDISEVVLNSETVRNHEAEKHGFVIVDEKDCCPKCFAILNEKMDKRKGC